MKRETLQVYTFSGESSSSDHLPMKQKRKSTKTVSKYPFQFSDGKTKTEFACPFSDQLQTAVKGTNHTVTTADNRIFHRKLISQPMTPFKEEPSNRGTGPRGPDGRFARKEDNTQATPDRSPLQDGPTDTSPDLPDTLKSGTFDRGKPKLIRNREQSTSPEKGREMVKTNNWVP